jgi:hypothetical protein
MNTFITSEWTVRDVLQACPDKAQVFFRLRTDCAGCWLQHFCTLKDVSGAYALEISDILKSLQESSEITTQRRTT